MKKISEVEGKQFASSLNICPEACCMGYGGERSNPSHRRSILPTDPWKFPLQTMWQLFSSSVFASCFLPSLSVPYSSFVALLPSRGDAARDGILGHPFNKRPESFAPCSSQSLLLAEFTIFSGFNNPCEKIHEKRKSNLFMNSIL
jgi:hypothetical protein